MPPKTRSGGQPPQGRVYHSTPTQRQMRFPPRRRLVRSEPRSARTSVETAEKRQRTLTQMDYLKLGQMGDDEDDDGGGLEPELVDLRTPSPPPPPPRRAGAAGEAKGRKRKRRRKTVGDLPDEESDDQGEGQEGVRSKLHTQTLTQLYPVLKMDLEDEDEDDENEKETTGTRDGVMTGQDRQKLERVNSGNTIGDSQDEDDESWGLPDPAPEAKTADGATAQVDAPHDSEVMIPETPITDDSPERRFSSQRIPCTPSPVKSAMATSRGKKRARAMARTVRFEDSPEGSPTQSQPGGRSQGLGCGVVEIPDSESEGGDEELSLEAVKHEQEPGRETEEEEEQEQESQEQVQEQVQMQIKEQEPEPEQEQESHRESPPSGERVSDSAKSGSNTDTQREIMDSDDDDGWEPSGEVTPKGSVSISQISIVHATQDPDTSPNEIPDSDADEDGADLEQCFADAGEETQLLMNQALKAAAGASPVDSLITTSPLAHSTPPSQARVPASLAQQPQARSRAQTRSQTHSQPTPAAPPQTHTQPKSSSQAQTPPTRTRPPAPQPHDVFSQSQRLDRAVIQQMPSLGPRSDVFIQLPAGDVALIAAGRKDHVFLTRRQKVPEQVVRFWIFSQGEGGEGGGGEVRYMASVGPAMGPGEIADGSGVGNAAFNSGDGRAAGGGKGGGGGGGEKWAIAQELRQVYELADPVGLEEMVRNEWVEGRPERHVYVPPAVVQQQLSNLKGALFAE